MKWMGGWSEQDFNDASPKLIDYIIEMINEEAERNEAARNV